MATTLMRVMEIGGAVHRSTIHSGHYMMSCLDETSDDTDSYGYVTATDAEPQRSAVTLDYNSNNDNGLSFSSKDTKMSGFIENNLAELLRYMTLTYNGTLPSPKWKDFKGIKLKLREKIRLNNIIWREWHMQYIKFKNPVACQFDVPTSDRTHDKPEAVVLEGKYCKRRLESLAVEYSRWRLYAKQQRKPVKYEDQQKIENGNLDGFLALIQSFADETASQFEDESNNKKLSFSSDTLFTSLAQPFAFPCAKEIAAEARNYFNSVMIVQPGLIQLQPNLPENLDSYVMKPCKPLEGKKINERNPILSSLLTGTYSGISGLVAEKTQLSTVDVSSLPLLNDKRLTSMTAITSSSAMPISNQLSSFELNTSFSQFSIPDFSMTDNMNYLSISSSPTSSTTFMQSEMVSDMSSIGFETPVFSPLPFASPCSTQSSQTNYLRALLQSNGDFKLQKDETVATSSSSGSSVQPNRRRKSTGQPVHTTVSSHVCNKSVQRLVDSEIQDRSHRRASTGTMIPGDALTSTNSETFAVPQKVPKLKSHSVGSRPLQESQPMTVRRRKTSCITREFQMTCHIEDAGVLVGSSSITSVGSPLLGTTCHQSLNLVTDVDPLLFDVPLISQPLQTDGQFEPEVFDCEMNNSSLSPLTPGQLLANVERNSNSMPTSSVMECLITSNPEHDSQLQQPQHQCVEQRRALHLSSEQKRRVSINSGFERLDELIRGSGEKPNFKSSKSSTLLKSAQFIRNLQKERLQLQREADGLKKEIQLMQDGLNLLQSNLPVNGCIPAARQKTEAMCELYNDYVRKRTQSNWKFWIFGQLMRPVYDTYMHSLSTVFVTNMGQAFKNWIDQYCCLPILRPAFSNELREICKKTSIINNPSKLPQEALQAANSSVICNKPD